MNLWLRIVELATRLGVAIAEAVGRKRSAAPPLPEPLPPSHEAEVERRVEERIRERFPQP